MTSVEQTVCLNIVCWHSYVCVPPLCTVMTAWNLDFLMKTWSTKPEPAYMSCIHQIRTIKFIKTANILIGKEQLWQPGTFLWSDKLRYCITVLVLHASRHLLSVKNIGNKIFISPLPFPVLIPGVCSALLHEPPFRCLQVRKERHKEVVDSPWADMVWSKQRDHCSNMSCKCSCILKLVH